MASGVFASPLSLGELLGAAGEIAETMVEAVISDLKPP